MQQERLYDDNKITSNSHQLAILKKHFPQCFDKNGDFISHKMEEIVGESGLKLSSESYSFNWLGKSYARLLANENPHTLIKEDKFHNTQEQNKESQNLLIKGDNLEVLKHLSNAYSESIKMIYIDPPYNTGTDGFVYNDDRKFTSEELSRLAGVDIEEARRILAFTQSKANSHSAWLTFMYPRLYVARELLKEDGVIFISIDENEQAQLKLLCDEVFGEGNFIESICWNKRIPKNDKGIGNIHEYILVYVKDSTKKHEFMMIKDGLDDIYELLRKLKTKKLSLKDAEVEVKKLYKKNAYDRGITLYNSLNDEYRLWGKINMSWPNAETFGPRYEILHPITKKPVKVPERGWRWKKETFYEALNFKDGKYLDIKKLYDGSYICGKIWFASDENTQPSSIKFLDEVENFLLRSILSTKSDGGVELEKLFDGKSYFSYPKPTSLLKILISSIKNSDNEIFMDFFAGSGTTAHAVMQLNAEDGGERKFITVQIAEPTDEKSEAYKAGYKTIFEITKARIEKASQKIAEKNPNFKGDLGFKIYETIPVWDGYLEDIATLEDETTLFDGSSLNDEELDTLLTTYKLHDGIALSEALQEIKLDEYKAYLAKETLYCVHSGFSTQALKTLIEKLDSDATFEPSRIILFGYNFSTKHQRELDEALSSYANKKSIELDLIVRY